MWSQDWTFPGGIFIGDETSSLLQARKWSRPSTTIWTDGSRLDSGRIEAACAWQNQDGEWTGRCFHLGNNKEVFDAEAYAIYRALKIFEERR